MGQVEEIVKSSEPVSEKAKELADLARNKAVATATASSTASAVKSFIAGVPPLPDCLEIGADDRRIWGCLCGVGWTSV